MTPHYPPHYFAQEAFFARAVRSLADVAAEMEELGRRFRQTVTTGLAYVRAAVCYEHPAALVLHADLCAASALPLPLLHRQPRQAPCPRCRRVAHAGHTDYG